MKTILFAAAAFIAVPAFAQTTTTAPDTQSSTTGQMQNGDQAAPAPADPATTTQQAPMQSTPNGAASTTTDQGMTATAPMPPAGTTGGGMTAGGYQPSTAMPMAQNGVRPTYTPGPSVEQAYPAPAPLASYPICKKGQFDKCMQRGGK